MSIKKVEYKDFELTKNDSSHENRILKTNDRTIKNIDRSKLEPVKVSDYREDLPELLKRHIKRLEDKEEKLKIDSIKLSEEKQQYFSKYDEMIKKYKKTK